MSDGGDYAVIFEDDRNRRCRRKGHRWRTTDRQAGGNVWNYESCTRFGCIATRRAGMREQPHA